MGEYVENCGHTVFDSGWEGVRGGETIAYAYEDARGGGVGGYILGEACVVCWVAN